MKTTEVDLFEQYEKPLIEGLIQFLWMHREELENNGGSPDTIQWIDDSIDLVEIGFLGEIPDSDRQIEISEREEKLTFKEALKEIFVRMENSNYFEE